jgi:hypothetical protein
VIKEVGVHGLKLVVGGSKVGVIVHYVRVSKFVVLRVLHFLFRVRSSEIREAVRNIDGAERTPLAVTQSHRFDDVEAANARFMGVLFEASKDKLAGVPILRVESCHAFTAMGTAGDDSEEAIVTELKCLHHFVLERKGVSILALVVLLNAVDYGDSTLDVNLKVNVFPVLVNHAMTGHKLQGKTKQNLIVSSWSYSRNWPYVAISRVRTHRGLFLREPLDPSKDYSYDSRLRRMMAKMTKKTPLEPDDDYYHV